MTQAQVLTYRQVYLRTSVLRWHSNLKLKLMLLFFFLPPLVNHDGVPAFRSRHYYCLTDGFPATIK